MLSRGPALQHIISGQGMDAMEGAYVAAGRYHPSPQQRACGFGDLPHGRNVPDSRICAASGHAPRIRRHHRNTTQPARTTKPMLAGGPKPLVYCFAVFFFGLGRNCCSPPTLVQSSAQRRRTRSQIPTRSTLPSLGKYS